MHAASSSVISSVVITWSSQETSVRHRGRRFLSFRPSRRDTQISQDIFIERFAGCSVDDLGAVSAAFLLTAHPPRVLVLQTDVLPHAMFDPPYMPLYFGDVLRRTLYWSGEERALLLLLSAAQWCSGPLPLDLSQLATALQFDEETFRRLWSGRVHTLFTATSAGFVDEELETRRENVARLSGARRAAGQASGKMRRARAEQTTDSLLEQKNEHGARTKARTNGRALVRTPIQSNPIQSRPDHKPQISESTSVAPDSKAASSPFEPEPSPDADPPPAAAASNGTSENGKARPRRRRIPADHPVEALRDWATEHAPRVNFDTELALLRDHEFRDPHSDWDAVVRNWLRRAAKQTTRGGDEQITRFERHKRRLYGDA